MIRKYFESSSRIDISIYQFQNMKMSSIGLELNIKIEVLWWKRRFFSKIENENYSQYFDCSFLCRAMRFRGYKEWQGCKIFTLTKTVNNQRYTELDLKKQGDLWNSLILQGVTPSWHVAQLVSRAPPHHTLPAFLNLNGTFETLLL